MFYLNKIKSTHVHKERKDSNIRETIIQLKEIRQRNELHIKWLYTV